MRTCILAMALAGLMAQPGFSEDTELPREFRWSSSGPFAQARDFPGMDCVSIKDPSIVRFADRWHVFATVRGKPRTHGIVYLSFADWPDAAGAEQHLLPMHAGFFCAPQVFYFTPHRRWYLICQASSDEWQPNYQPAFSTSERIDDPKSWSPLKPLFTEGPQRRGNWLDFWIIADDHQSHLFFTSLDGRMWRSATKLENFPHGWSEPEVALEGDVFEASHTYRLRGRDAYLTLIEAQNGIGWRYYKAYLARRLEGPWEPLAATKDQAFASLANVEQSPHWTDSVSHGELLRSGHDERLEVEPSDFRFLIQGVLERDRNGKPYGEIPWRLGLLQLELSPDR